MKKMGNDKGDALGFYNPGRCPESKSNLINFNWYDTFSVGSELDSTQRHKVTTGQKIVKIFEP
jgi:hypothetical protein